MRHLPLLLSLATAVTVFTSQAAEPAPRDRIERGRYLVNASGCADCHTPLKMGSRGPEPDVVRSFSGHPQSLVMPSVPTLPAGPWQVISSSTNTAWAGPWGVSFTANLTPDAETGLGRWSEKDFVQTLRKNRHLGQGRPLLPPMPAAYGEMTDEDLIAIFAYLKTLAPIHNRVPAPLPPGSR
jgi:hypothetical protein